MREFTVPHLGPTVGEIWKQYQLAYIKLGQFTVASPLSNTPLPLYSWIIDHATEFPEWSKVNFVLMDEMLEGSEKNPAYVASSDQASYEGFACRNFLDPVGEKVGQKIRIVKPDLKNIGSFHAPIHLLILALGIGGNYANVMPGTKEKTGWHIAHLTPDFRQAHTQTESASYAGANFREYGMSLGPKQVLEADNVIVMATGEKKRGLVKELRSRTKFDPDFPISIIYHPKVSDRVELYFTHDVIS